VPGTYTTSTWTPHVGRAYEYQAFTPTSLHKRLPGRWSRDVIGLADRALAQIASLPTEESLGGLSVHLGRAEAGGSSMIEGYHTGARRLFEHQFEVDASHDRRAVPVFDNWRLMQRVRATETADAAEILEWHRLLMHHDPRSHPGSFRRTQNWIGGDVYGPKRASFVPPSPQLVEPLIDDLFDYAHSSSDHPIVRAAVLHTQFETIHPFADGNGRVGRALIHWALRTHAPSVPPLALIWYSHGDRYYRALDAWRTLRDPEPWVAYFASSMIEAVAGARTLIDRLADLPDRWLASTPARAGSLKRRLIEDLVAHPIVDIASATERLGATPSAFSRAARSLADAGVLTETRLPRRRRGQPRKVYEARDVFAVLDGFVDQYRTGE